MAAWVNEDAVDMGAAYFIVLERKLEGIETEMDGKSLARHIKPLDHAARELAVRPLSEFLSVDPKQAAEFMHGEGMDTSGMELPPLRQFNAKDGLATVRALAKHAVSRKDGVEADLRECERILSAAAQHGVGW